MAIPARADSAVEIKKVRWRIVRETGNRRDVPRFFDEWKLVNAPSVPAFPAVPPRCSPVENIPLQAERHSAGNSKLFAFPPELLFTFRPECCSESHRNRVRLHTGIAFTFDRIPHNRLSEELRADTNFHLLETLQGFEQRDWAGHGRKEIK
ncbi:MAG: hypothetical protein LAP21_27960 [Acidobacteriia bacterium]|nr:hypothetical protein [Terriglobia bacterium]